MSEDFHNVKLSFKKVGIIYIWFVSLNFIYVHNYLLILDTTLDKSKTINNDYCRFLFNKNSRMQLRGKEGKETLA